MTRENILLPAVDGVFEGGIRG